MSTQLFPILLILLSLLILFRTAKSKGKFGTIKFFICLISVLILAGSLGLLLEKPWARMLVNISLGAFVLIILLPALGRLFGVAMFTKIFYEGMDEEDQEE